MMAVDHGVSWDRSAIVALTARSGTQGGLVEILYAAAGFLHVRREVYETVQHVTELPLCNPRFGKPLMPYFVPMIIPDESAHTLLPDAKWYLPEDFNFSERARRAGYKVMADSSIRLGHLQDLNDQDFENKLRRDQWYIPTLNGFVPNDDGGFAANVFVKGNNEEKRRHWDGFGDC